MGIRVPGLMFPVLSVIVFVTLSYTAEPPDTLWMSTFGGDSNDYGWAVTETSDGNFVMVGNTWSYGAGDADFWLIKTDADGDIIWDKLLGGPGIDGGVCIRQTEDGNLIVLGDTSSFGTGNSDLWLVRLVY